MVFFRATMVDDETGSGEDEAELEGLFKTEMIWFEDRVLLEMFLRSCEDTRAILWREGMGRMSRRKRGEDETRYIDLRSRGRVI